MIGRDTVGSFMSHLVRHFAAIAAICALLHVLAGKGPAQDVNSANEGANSASEEASGPAIADQGDSDGAIQWSIESSHATLPASPHWPAIMQ